MISGGARRGPVACPRRTSVRARCSSRFSTGGLHVLLDDCECRLELLGRAELDDLGTGEDEQVVYAGDVALVANRWVLEGTTPDGERVRLAGRSADVLRRASSGDWRIAIDDPWGGGE